jgi:hypothetical protein
VKKHRLVTVLLLAMLAPATAVAAGGATPTVPGSWHRLSASPIAPEDATSVWTGKQVIVFGRNQRTALDGHDNPYSIGSTNVAAAYDPATGRWRRLSPPKGPTYSPGPLAVWTGKEVLVWGPFDYRAYNPSSNRWRTLPPAPTARGFALWTGKELIGWGGGCCGDAFTDGSAYNPATNRWQRLPRSPLAGSQHPLAVWTGHEVIVLVGSVNPDSGKQWPARLARAAVYNPLSKSWRRTAPLPVPLIGAAGAWDGRELLVAQGRTAFAYDPGKNSWRRLASVPTPRSGAFAVWGGGRLLLVGGRTGSTASSVPATRVLAYDPKADRWSVLPRAPLPATLSSTVVWTGHQLVVWGHVPTATWGHDRPAGAAFTPASN